ncbi:RIP metalloprotease RseP [Sphingomonadales bacterium 56]|uniref:RIP metalloprotease RseP n=1 Tax=unclassified Sphingobium TaxID=2611147 RepID=UPI00191A7468|nr:MULTISPECIES: RIP metalloprotease RseP [unclassified Sphingobium]MBY2927287.1 RIP metalloprotease RseP [Sphingomonadales bacterium 56]MBY2957355.1 RIP metalloprotease RseP [Sphingomonadales bacterium 58]CAD7334889.1 Metalloprotease MmpA [Sphingobium sp. S8]CAD7334908.1 Metalloprotease MmpA [Sphingobium sp. S6]
MIQNPGFLLTVLAFVAVIGPLVFVHELGHYLVGRWFGVKAEAFSIGFGPELAAWVDKRGTRWRIGALPLGGYVRFKGDMNAASQTDPAWLQLPPSERAESFPAKPLWQKAAIVAAGPFINFLFAILILSTFAFVYGESRTPAVAGKVQAGSAAAEAGIQAGDRILSLNGREMTTFDDLRLYAQIRPGEPVTILVERSGRTVEKQGRVGAVQEQDGFGNRFKVGRLGIAPAQPVIEPVELWRAPAVALKQTGQIIRTMVETLGQILGGGRSVKELGGPLKIAEVSGQAATLGVESFVFFMALISINLGFINLLPIPMLDGGHLLFYGVEAIQRRPVSARVQEWAYRSGLAVLLAMMMLVTFNDLSSFGLWERLSGLIG